MTTPMLKPPRGFTIDEYAHRLTCIQKHMAEQKVDVILLTNQVDIEYYSGFKSQFFASPTRPWYVLLPIDDKPKAIIPGIGEVGMRATWIDDIQIWSSPNPADEGITLLAATLKPLLKKYQCLGIPQGPESHLRMPLADYQRLLDQLPNIKRCDVTDSLRAVRYIKSVAEIAKIEYICQLVSQGFMDLPQLLKCNESERINCQRFKRHLLTLGVDDFPYLISASGADGYGSIIMGPSERIIKEGDIFMIDTGCVYDSYFCDFDRNYAFGSVSDAAKRAYATVYRATDAGFSACQVGNTTSDVFAAMNAVIQAEGGSEHGVENSVGRFGHGLGLQLTEFPSNTATDATPLADGVILTLEPSMQYGAGREMVHEENVVITHDGPKWLTTRAPAELPMIAG